MTLWLEKAFLIAEAGVNHNGDIDMARRLVDAAVAAGADAIKFQTFSADALVAKDASMAGYQKKNVGTDSTQHAMLKSLELPREVQIELKAYAESQGILWFSTAFDPDSTEFLVSLDLPVWKIPSGEITNYPYLRRIGGLGKPVIVSTGMCNLGDIDAALSVLWSAGLTREQTCVLHCNTEYPTPWQDVNLKAMPLLGQAFGTVYGYSDHTQGIEIPVAAVALGARVIEKHFTLDRALPGPDHAASLEPNELAAMVSTIRHIEKALGDGVKRLTPSESANREVARKSIVAARPIRQGELLSEDNLTTRRPGTGISPMFWPKLIGRAASRDYMAGEQIEW
jgi:N,N'-diacetyllegionaminate synthase